MEKKKIEIIVTGLSATGKSTIIYIINEALKKEGFDVAIEFDFRLHKSELEHISQNIDKMKSAVKEKSEIFIKERPQIRDFKTNEQRASIK